MQPAPTWASWISGLHDFCFMILCSIIFSWIPAPARMVIRGWRRALRSSA
jgi:hypothetical protein